MSRKGEIINTSVIRLYCPFSHKNKIQYTITILPSWLQPYLRRVVNLVIDAIDKYVQGFARDYTVAALEMGAESDRTFRRYFYRVRSRIADWNTHLAKLLASSNLYPEAKKQPVKMSAIFSFRWEILLRQTKKYCDWLDENGKTYLPLFGQWQIRYILSFSGFNGLGLGP